MEKLFCRSFSEDYYTTLFRKMQDRLTVGTIRRYAKKLLQIIIHLLLYHAACGLSMKTPPDFSAGGISQEFLIEHILIIDDTNIISCWSDFINPVVNQFVEFTAFIVLFE